MVKRLFQNIVFQIASLFPGIVSFALVRYETFNQSRLKKYEDEEYIKMRFFRRNKKYPNLDNPKTYNEKLLWLKLHYFDPVAVQCADKYLVREYVEKHIGSRYLNELLGVYESVDDIEIDTLPNQFVLKVTHGSGFNIICHDKASLNWNVSKVKLRRWLKKDYYWYNREWVYKGIKPKIISEKYLVDDGSTDLKDYKIFCFHGEPRLIQVDFDRFSSHKRNLYDLGWNLLDISIQFPNDPNEKISRPVDMDLMLELAAKLSKPFPHVRVDFYHTGSQVIFGEMTFFHGSGSEIFSSYEFALQMGSWLDLNKVEVK